MARYKITLTVDVEHNGETAGSRELAEFSQHFSEAAKRMIGEARYRGEPVIVTDCKVSGAQRISA